MKLYSDLPARRAVQVLADLGMVAWVYLCVRVAQRVHDATLGLAEPGRRLEAAGTGFTGRMNQAGDSVDDLPLLDDRIAAPFRSAAGVGDDFASAGRDLVGAVERFATVLGLVTALTPIVLVVGLWLVLRWRFVRRATAAQRFVDGAPDLDLFALRAMANQPMTRLARISPDPAGAWRRGDPDVVRALAVLELKEVGLRPPPVSAAG
ncbi:hypothetical protein KMZ32_04225 [Phycicoccus sp. MAQZ13P-2]|uniref:hypothetical protein n=1 Tax=Phycicoccus mangrovi TaxID=2840470 RepID=UPI001BFFF439|nr:hypothetical protein [Phycicoccus mangrovi]MBT9254516.1 hypothetical protein [Phycicoccus mangrovi]MBT9273279.1 hypothetical protein [Phycicoccus mangrovi]